jgi:predicted nuclease with TOPRIM domain
MDLRGPDRHGLLQDQKGASISIVSALQTELFHARSRICEIENEERSFKEKVKRLPWKVEEARKGFHARLLR